MEYGSGLSISQRLSIEQQLLREEKFIVHALKTVKEERHGLQREGSDILGLLQEVLRQGKSSSALGQEGLQASAKQATEQPTTVKPTTAPADVHEPVPTSLSLAEEFNLPSLDDIICNDLELNLTVPSHHFYDQLPEQEEFEDIGADDDYEVEISMLMNGKFK